MSKPAGSAAPLKKRNTIPVALILEPSAHVDTVLRPYCEAVTNALQTLHPTTEIVYTAITPSSHAIPLNPFLPAAAFLAALPSFVRRPARPASTIWRSQTGLLRAIKLARRRLLEGAMAGAGGEGRGQLPKYVVIMTGTDVENMGGDEIWLEDDDQGESWESLAKNFTRAPHSTTLVSLISLGHTPNMEKFWRDSSGKFPQNLIHTSLAPSPPSVFTFPVISPAHACFLCGFHNANNSRPSTQSTPTAPSPAATANPNKRAAPPDPAAANKKAKPNPPTMPGASVSPQLAAASLAGATKPTPPNPLRTPALPTSHLQQSPNLQAKPIPAVPSLPANLTNENLQQYINEMKATAQRNGQPPPTAADIQAAALAAYANNQQQRAAAAAAASASAPAGQPRQPAQGQGQGQGTPRIGGVKGPSTPSLGQAPLPALPADMKAKIEAHLRGIQEKQSRGELTQEEANNQYRRLQEFANQSRMQMAQKQQEQAAAAAAAQNGTANHGQGLGLNIPLAPGGSQTPSQQAQRLPAVPPQKTPAPQRQDSAPRQVIWRGGISFSFNQGATGRSDFTMYCQATPMQHSAVVDLANVKFPPAFRISSLVSIDRPALQALANEHTLPAMSLTPIPSEVLPKEVREKQTAASGGNGNEQLYGMFAQSIQARANCGIVRFPGTNNGLVLVSVPREAKIIALVFTKIALPDAWVKSIDAAAAAHQRQASQQSGAPPQPQPPVARPPSAQSGMFSSPVPFSMPLPGQSTPAPAPSFTTPIPSQQPFAGSSTPGLPTFNLPPQPPAPAPPASAAPAGFPAGGVAGMDFEELKQLLGPEQFAAIMSGV
ncbi:hypothetical protein JCM10207_002305 [Rhodosporidiobolus poonsookiae]